MINFNNTFDKYYEISELITIIKDSDYMGINNIFEESCDELAGLMNQWNPLPQDHLHAPGHPIKKI